jgi:hypothetical protein
MIQIPLSQVSSASEFAAAVEKHRNALERHNLGKSGIAAPTADPLVQSVIARVPQTGPVAKRGPDDFVIQPYEIIDDTPPAPKNPEQELALSVLRETIR